jgi:hypothetical protein
MLEMNLKEESFCYLDVNTDQLVKVKGCIVGYFGITKVFHALLEDKWMVIHIPSGQSMGNYLYHDVDSAVDFVMSINRFDWSGETIKEVAERNGTTTEVLISLIHTLALSNKGSISSCI